MARQTCPQHNQDRPARYARPAPLYDRVTPAPVPEEAAARPPCPGASARAALEDSEMHIHHSGIPVPTPATEVECETLRLLRQQNQVLTEMLCIMTAQAGCQG